MNSKSVSVRVEQLNKAYGAILAVNDVTFVVEAGSTVSLLGPSGCGKTTTLRCIAGLEVPTGGRISIGERTFFDAGKGIFVEPEKRRIGMVFQSYAIWPHMTVGGNVDFPLRIGGMRKSAAREQTAEILKLVGLEKLQDRPASQLSGGQQQRVALARALVHEPSVVLFDEPLSNLDANLRDRMRAELQTLQGRLGFTAIYVTHDQQEAMALSDRVAIMHDGSIVQEGPPREVFQYPTSAFTARFLGYSNGFEGEVTEVETAADGTAKVAIDVDGQPLWAHWRSAEKPRKGAAGVVAFRADRVVLDTTDRTDGNILTGDVEALAFLGSRFEYTIRCGRMEIKVDGSPDHPVAAGTRVSLRVAPEHCHAFAG